MTQRIFSNEIHAILEDGTEVRDVSGFVVDNKRIYKTKDNTILTGSKKIKKIISCFMLVPAHYVPFILNMEYE